MAVVASEIVARRGAFLLAVDRFSADSGGTALLGANGSGKTTLLLALQGLLPHAGTVEQTGRHAGVFAQPAVLRGAVLWNVAVIACAVLGLERRTARLRAEEALAAVGLADTLALDARSLSSGQRQRLALARALVLEPRTLYLDEPFANIDADGRPALRNLVHAYVMESGCTLILATQNLADVAALCERAMVLRAGKAVDHLNVTAIGSSPQPYLQALVAESYVPGIP